MRSDLRVYVFIYAQADPFPFFFLKLVVISKSRGIGFDYCLATLRERSLPFPHRAIGPFIFKLLTVALRVNTNVAPRTP